ncbi:MAG: transcription termination factor NusA [Patescibacteria group bacterium]
MPKTKKQIQQQMVRTEFAAAISQIAKERKIEPEKIVSSIEEALVAAYRKDQNIIVERDEEGNELYPKHTAKVDQNSGESRIFLMDSESAEPKDVTPPGFGRIAAQTAKQVILQKIREAEKDSIIQDYSGRLGEIVSGMVLRMDGKNVIIDIGRGQGVMPPEEQMRGEFYKMNSRITVFIKDIRETYKGQAIIVSRSDKQVVSKLFEREVPEVASGVVKVKAVAREAGVRSKIAVFTDQSGVDPVGACVGQKGVRVQEVIKELNNEKVDIIPYSEDIKMYLAAALAPAESLSIDWNEAEKTAVVTAPDDQLSLAIGRGGQNVRLAAKLTGYKISIKSKSGEEKVNVTGQEEYEIDQQIDGITPEVRAVLIQNRLTTLEDLRYRKEKWMLFDQIPEDQKELLSNAVEKYEGELVKRESERAAAAVVEPKAE